MIVWLHDTDTLFNFWKRETISSEIPVSLLSRPTSFKVHCFLKVASLPHACNPLEEAREAQI